MSIKNAALHGNAPDKSPVGLLLIDTINDLEFPEGKQFFKYAVPAAKQIQVLKQRVKQAKIPVIYVNDNFGRWQSNFSNQVEHCLNDGVLGQSIVELLKPDEDDYFVLKPKHSGFYSTVLDLLLNYLEIKTVILTGFATNICVLFTANDAYLRDFNLWVPADCVASNSEAENDQAIQQIKSILKADIRPSTAINLQALVSEAKDKPRSNP